jgi:hypothetical protein
MDPQTMQKIQKRQKTRLGNGKYAYSEGLILRSFYLVFLKENRKKLE